MNIEKLVSGLEEAGYYIEKKQALAVWAALNTRPTPGAFLFGPAGSGKSELPQALGRVLKRETVFAQCFPGTREDDLIVKLIPDEHAPSGVKALDGPVLEAAKKSSSSQVILVLDEWDKTRPAADSFLLDFLQSGRIRFNGASCRAVLENLAVFLTANDEREISEPLLRRLPMVKFDHLPLRVVGRALEASHPGHPYIPAALKLYERCLAAGLPKPATIQELRQLLDAITLLGHEADWDSLVFQFITKSEEAHTLLAHADSDVRVDFGDDLPELDPEDFAGGIEEAEPAPRAPRMPTLSEARGFNPSLPVEDGEIPPDATLVRDFSPEAYSRLAVECEPGPSPLTLGDAQIVAGKIVTRRPFQLFDTKSWEVFFQAEGEILIEARLALSQIKAMTFMEAEIVYYSDDLIYLRAPDVEARFVRDGGAYRAEFVAQTGSAEALAFLKRASEASRNPASADVYKFALMVGDEIDQGGAVTGVDTALFAVAIGMSYVAHGYSAGTHVSGGKAYLYADALLVAEATSSTPPDELRKLAREYIVRKFGEGVLSC